MRWMAWPVVAAMATVAALSVAGCSGRAGTPAGNPAVTLAGHGGAAAAGPTVAAPRTPAAVPVSGLTRGMILPLEAYELNYPKYIEIQQARLALESTCMRGYGFSFSPKLATDAISYDASNMARRYGLADGAEATRYGYFVPMAAPSSGPVLSAKESLVLTGTSAPGRSQAPAAAAYDGKRIPSDGCVGEADRQLGYSAAIPRADLLDQQSLARSQRLPEVRAVISAWSACMQGAGYQAASPLTSSLISQQYRAAPGSALDRKIAVTDVACKQRTNLVRVWFDAESLLQKQYIAANQTRLRRDAASLAAVERKAEAVLASITG
jgi:hypothetical protein